MQGFGFAKKEDYKVLNKLGGGTYGDVYKVVHKETM